MGQIPTERAENGRRSLVGERGPRAYRRGLPCAARLGDTISRAAATVYPTTVLPRPHYQPLKQGAGAAVPTGNMHIRHESTGLNKCFCLNSVVNDVDNIEGDRRIPALLAHQATARNRNVS